MKKLSDISQKNKLQIAAEAKEEKLFSLLQEAISETDLQNLVKVLPRLEAVIGNSKGKLKNLSAAINTAQNQIAKVMSTDTSGGGIKGLFTRAKNKQQIASTIKDLLAFEAAVFSGMKQLPKIVTAFKDLDVDLNSDKGIGEVLFANQKDDAVQRLTAMFQQAFTPPSGIFGTKQTPFIPDPSKISNEMLLLNPKEIQDMAQRAGSMGRIPVSPQAIQQFIQADQQTAQQQLTQQPTQQQQPVAPATGTSAGQDTTLGQKSTNPSQPSEPSGGEKNKIPTSNEKVDIKSILQKARINVKSKNALDAFESFYEYLKANPPK